jgi:hypothetical protein
MIEIDDDCADAIIIISLAQSYASIEDNLKKGNYWHEDDVAAWKEILPAIMLVGSWYSTDFPSEIKKAKKAGKKK